MNREAEKRAEARARARRELRRPTRPLRVLAYRPRDPDRPWRYHRWRCPRCHHPLLLNWMTERPIYHICLKDEDRAHGQNAPPRPEPAAAQDHDIRSALTPRRRRYGRWLSDAERRSYEGIIWNPRSYDAGP